MGPTEMTFPPIRPNGFFNTPNQKTNTSSKFTFNPEQTNPNKNTNNPQFPNNFYGFF